MAAKLSQRGFRASGAGLSRGTNHLGFIRTTLKSLTGFATLAHELIQNADDAAGATTLTFDVSNAAVRLTNDGSFTDCGDQDVPPEECPWLDDATHGSRCDFHSFRDVASGDKSDRSDTTGSFGIGFTAVYQITDHPQLLSSGRHWRLDELADHGDRIQVCDGCDDCRDHSGTDFILPWAREESRLRDQLKAPPVAPDAADGLLEVLRTTVPTAMIFLRRLERIELRRDGALVVRHDRIRDGATTVVEISPDPEELGDDWLMLEGSFAEAATDIRNRFSDKIESQRTDRVTIAVPRHPERHAGRFCAFLPTEQPTGLPVHINADFVPTPDRRRLQHDGYVGEWNAAAVVAAGESLSEQLVELREWLGGKGLWQLIRGAKQIAEMAPGDMVGAAQAALWGHLEQALPSAPVLPTSDTTWTTPSSGVFLATDEEYDEFATTVSDLGIELAQRDIRSILFDLRSVARRMDLLDVVEKLESTAEPEPEPGPGLLELLEHLLATTGRHSSESRTRLRELRVFPAADGAWASASDLWVGDPRTRGLFSGELGIFRFLDVERIPGGDESPLQAEVARVTVDAALTGLEARDGLADADVDCGQLLRWFRSSDEGLGLDDTQRARIAALSIFPASDQKSLRSLTELALPGGFHDPLWLADNADVSRLSGLEAFLRDLGARDLTLETYVTQFVPANLDLATSGDGTWRELVDVLAQHLPDLEDHPAALSTLRDVPLVETDNGFVQAQHAYLDGGPDLFLLVGDRPVASRSSASVERFYEVLGAARSPRWRDIRDHLERTVGESISESAVNVVAAVVRHLAHLGHDEASANIVETLAELAWLPVIGSDEWHLPGDVDLPFQDYLFKSTGDFIGLKVSLVRSASTFLQAVGCRQEPTVEQVTTHLVNCASSGTEPNPQIYDFLERRAEASEVARLSTKAVLHVGDGEFVRPDQVFLEDHPFGGLRYVLGDTWRRYPDFLQVLGVKDRPDHDSAKSVIGDLSRKHGVFNTSLRDTDDLAALLAAWEIIAEVETELPDEWFGELRRKKCVPDRRLVLVVPTSLLFDDQPHVTSLLDGLPVNDVVPRRATAARAMERAGVAPLSAVLRVELLEGGDRIDAAALMTVLIERRPQLVRLFEHSGHESATVVADRLGQLHLVHCSELVLKYEIERFRYVSDPVAVDAHLLRENSETHQILTTRSDTFSRGLVRELLFAAGLNAGEAASLVAIVKEVLDAADADEAGLILNDCGYPPVQIREESELAAAVAEVADAPEAGGADTETETAWTPIKGEDDIPPTPGGGTFAGVGTSGSTTTAGPAGGSGPEVGGGEAGVATGTDTGSSPGGSPDGAGGKTKREKKSLLRTRLVSYVVPGSSESENTEAEAGIRAQISATDRAGVDRVLAYEHAHGRHPVEMPHDNPGYDVKSADSSGTVVRHIEVKSTGTWDSLGVKVSTTQFDFAREHPDTAWLYVVAQPEDDDAFELFAIADPAHRVTDYMFDRGWRDAAIEVHRPHD